MGSVLVVDDSDTVRLLIAEALRKEGLLVYEAANGAEGLAYSRDQVDLDIIFVDLHMPGINGIAMVSSFRELEIYDETVIVVVTTDADERSKSEGRRVGVDLWIVKPINFDNIASFVKESLEKKSAIAKRRRRQRDR